MSDDARSLYRPEPREESEASRLLRLSPRFCIICNEWGAHFADSCPSVDSEQIVEGDSVRVALKEARDAIQQVNPR